MNIASRNIASRNIASRNIAGGCRVGAVVGLLVVAGACGSGAETAAPNPSTAGTTTGGSSPTAPGDGPNATAPGDGPNATIAPEVPAEFRGAIGPVEVIGDPLVVLGSTDSITDPAIGEPAPVIVGLSPAGETVRIDPANQGPTMVVFLAHWCPHCNAEVPRLNELRDAGRIPADLNVVAVATSSNPSAPNYPPGDWLEQVDWTWAAMLDGVDMERELWIAADAYGVEAFPFITLVDAAGLVVDRWSGESTTDELAAHISVSLGLD